MGRDRAQHGAEQRTISRRLRTPLLQNEGNAEKVHGLLGSTYGGGLIACFGILKNWGADGELKGLEIS